MSATLFARGLFRANHFGYVYPVDGTPPSYPLSQAIYFNNTNISLQWHNTGPGLYNQYEVQVSLLPDFSTTILDSTSVTDNRITFVDSGTNDARRYWRWRGSADSGANYDRWSRVGSYWLNTAGAQNVSITRNSWMLINPSPVTDKYPFSIFPIYKTIPQHQYRIRSRNRVGTLLSEYITIKASIQFSFDPTRWLTSEEFSEARRFNETVKTFYLAIFNDYNFGEPVPNIWKVQFESDPDLSMFVAGRQGLLVGNLIFMEV